MSTVFVAGQTDVTLYFWAWNSDNTPRTDLTHSTSGLSVGYVRERAAEVLATVGGSPAPASLAADTTAHTDWGFRTVYANLVRVDLPDAAFAAGVKYVLPILNLAGAFFTRAFADDLSGGDPRAEFLQADVARWRGTQPNTLSSGRVDVTVGAMQANVMTAAAAAADLTTELQAGLATAAALTSAAADITTLLSRLSSARAGYLDNLNVGGAVASAAALTTVDNEVAVIDGIVDTLLARVTGAVALASDMSTLLSRVTATRAGYLDVLAGNVPADVKQINGAAVNGNGTSGNLWRGA